MPAGPARNVLGVAGRSIAVMSIRDGGGRPAAPLAPQAGSTKPISQASSVNPAPATVAPLAMTILALAWTGLAWTGLALTALASAGLALAGLAPAGLAFGGLARVGA